MYKNAVLLHFRLLGLAHKELHKIIEEFKLKCKYNLQCRHTTAQVVKTC